MFIGHYAVAFAAKKAAPKTSLGTLFLASQLLDLMWPLFLLSGVEHVKIEPGNTVVTPLNFYDYPISHSLAAVVLWSLAGGFLYNSITRYTRGAIVAGCCIFSHWLLDSIVHRPDLPLMPGGRIYIGLNLWSTLTGTIIVEGGIFIVGLILYLRTTAARDRVGKYALWSLVITLLVIYLGNLFGPPPPGVRAIAIAGNALWLFVPWAYWVDRHRRVSMLSDAGV